MTVEHRSFELRPHAPDRLEGTYLEAVRAKYDMPVEHVRAGHELLIRFGAEVGLVFDFDRVRLGSTFDAHRLAQAARGGSYEDTLVTGLFVAHFSQGGQLSDHDVLRDITHAAGMADALVDEVLGSDRFGIEVRADEATAAEMEVTGVPHFLIDGVWPVPQEPRTWTRWCSCSVGPGHVSALDAMISLRFFFFFFFLIYEHGTGSQAGGP